MAARGWSTSASSPRRRSARCWVQQFGAALIALCAPGSRALQEGRWRSSPRPSSGRDLSSSSTTRALQFGRWPRSSCCRGRTRVGASSTAEVDGYLTESANVRYDWAVTLPIALGLYGGGVFALAPVLLEPSILGDAASGLSKLSLIGSSSTLFATWALGSVALGRAAEKRGRKAVLVPSTVCSAVGALFQAAAPVLAGPERAELVFFVASALAGVGIGGFSSVGYTLVAESVSPGNRDNAVTVLNLGFAVSAVLLAACHLACGADWRLECVAHAVWVLACGLAVETVCVESPAFLANKKGRAPDADRALIYIATFARPDKGWRTPSGSWEQRPDSSLTLLAKSKTKSKKKPKVATAVVLPTPTQAALSPLSDQQQKDAAIVATPAELESAFAPASSTEPDEAPFALTLTLLFAFFAIEATYYGLDFASTNLGASSSSSTHGGGDLDGTLSFVALNVADIPGYLGAGELQKRYPLRPSTALLLAASGAMLVALVLTKQNVAVLATVGKAFNAGAFQIAFPLAAAAFPTSRRAAGVGLCSASARVGGLVAPPAIGLFPLNTAIAAYAALSLTSAALLLLAPTSDREKKIQDENDVTVDDNVIDPAEAASANRA